MNDKKKRSGFIRSICAGCSITFLGAISYLFIFGFEIIGAMLLAVSFGGLATTSAVVSEGIVGFFTTFFELFLEGISAVFNAIASIFSF